MLPFFLAPILGLLSLILPVLAFSPPREEAPLFPLLATGVKHMSPATLSLLFLSGVLLSGVFPGKASWMASFLVLAAMPMVILSEGMADPSSHNLFPFELVLYGILTLITLLGAGVGIVAKRKVTDALRR